MNVLGIYIYIWDSAVRGGGRGGGEWGRGRGRAGQGRAGQGIPKYVMVGVWAKMFFVFTNPKPYQTGF